jgi:hypothetical protein
VRIALTRVPSIIATGKPFSGEFRMMIALARGKPCRRFAGKLAIHFMPTAGLLPFIDANSALKRPFNSLSTVS